MMMRVPGWIVVGLWLMVGVGAWGADTLRLPPGMFLLTPMGGERFVQGEQVRVKWIGIELDSTVAIQLWDGGNRRWLTIGTAVATSGSYTWTIPDTLSGERFRVRVVSQKYGFVQSGSKAFFKIVPSGMSKEGAVVRVGRRDHDVAAEENVALFVEQNKGYIQVRWEGEPYRLTIYDLSGRVLWRQVVNAQRRKIEIGMERFGKGMYIVVMEFRGGVVRGVPVVGQ